MGSRRILYWRLGLRKLAQRLWNFGMRTNRSASTFSSAPTLFFGIAEALGLDVLDLSDQHEFSQYFCIDYLSAVRSLLSVGWMVLPHYSSASVELFLQWLIILEEKSVQVRWIGYLIYRPVKNSTISKIQSHFQQFSFMSVVQVSTDVSIPSLLSPRMDQNRKLRFV